MKGAKARPPPKTKTSASRPGLQAATKAHEEFMRELVRNGDAGIAKPPTRPTPPPRRKKASPAKSNSKAASRSQKAKERISARSELSAVKTKQEKDKVKAASAPVKVGLNSALSAGSWRDSVYRRLRPTAEEGSTVDFKWLESIARKEGWYVRASEIELKEELGKGACGKLIAEKLHFISFGSKVAEIGVVYAAKWRHLPVVAKRFLENKTSQQPEQLLRQRKIDLGSEISVLSTIKHPNIVSFYGASFEGIYANNPVYLMEICPKGDLEDVIQGLRKKNSYLKEHEMAKYIYQIGLGIEYLHSCAQPIVHRDLKPQNVLISAHGEAKLTDFGLATIIPKKTQAYQMTGHTGSLRYMAPEVFLGKSYSEKVDIYSYAMIIYYIVACYRPFGNIKVTRDLAKEIANEDKRPELTKIRYKSLRNKVGSLLKRAWSPSPSHRPDCHGILAELEGFPQFDKYNKPGCSIS